VRCENCGAELIAITTDLPFKVREPGIVILKGVPVLQCARCPQYLLRDEVLARVAEILRGVDTAIELEVVPYPA
jgi:YgiT-type zinc finger domain-containing protein